MPDLPDHPYRPTAGAEVTTADGRSLPLVSAKLSGTAQGGNGQGPGSGDPGGPGGDDEFLIEQVASAYRPASRDELRYHPAWHDLGPAGRERAFARARAPRELEAAIDPDGLSTTARAVLARITGRR